MFPSNKIFIAPACTKAPVNVVEQLSSIVTLVPEIAVISEIKSDISVTFAPLLCDAAVVPNSPLVSPVKLVAVRPEYDMISESIIR